MDRRQFLVVGAGLSFSTILPGRTDTRPYDLPVRALTGSSISTGSGFHWFGYYDKLQFDPTGRYVLGMKVGFEGRSPTADDVIEIGLIDLQNAEWSTTPTWTELGESRARG